MIPRHSRVVAIDDVEDHLQKIVWGLGKAGFCAMPFLFLDGMLENPPDQPLPGVRIVFSDIHLVGGGPNNEKTHAANIIRCLKRTVADGPYVLIFWSQFPGDSEHIAALISERAVEAKLTAPIGYASIDKNEVFNIPAVGGDDAFNANKLRGLILERLKPFKTLSVALSWEDRAARAAARTTDRLYEVVAAAEKPTVAWEQLLAYLACETVGHGEAARDLKSALDGALLPLLEDQLSLIGNEPGAPSEDLKSLHDLVSAAAPPTRPPSVAASQLNTSYLIEEVGAGVAWLSWSRGMVTELGTTFINSGPFVRAFGHDDGSLMRQEFATRNLTADEKRSAKLHVVELGPECDHVQAKVSTHRYLLALLIPTALLEAFNGGVTKPGKSPQYRNDSVFDAGKFSLRALSNGGQREEWHLLISCRCFMSLAAKAPIEGKPRFRLRRALLEDVAHRYSTHARRPGVMRFFG
jgi:hypothetical protein